MAEDIEDQSYAEVENGPDEVTEDTDAQVSKSNGAVALKAKSGSRSSSSRSRSRKRSGSRHHSSKKRHRKRSRSKSRSHSKPQKHSRRRKSRSSSSSESRSRSRSRHRRSRRRSRSRSRSSSAGYRNSYRRGQGSRFFGPRDCPPPSRCLGVFGMNVNTTESTLAHCFQQYGKIDKIQIIYDAKSGRSRGFGFVYFDSTQDSVDAKEQTNGLEIDGYRIRVDYSLTQRPHTPTPGIYMGKPMSRDEFYRGGRKYGGGGSPSPSYRRRSRSRSYS